MNAYTEGELATRIIEKAKTFGASLAGLADIASVLDLPPHRIYRNARSSAEGKSLLVIALTHPTTEPSLDWWDGKKGGSPGNRMMIRIAERIGEWVEEEFNIKVRLMPYHATRGGIFLKDAAVLSGLGVIGANNLLVTRDYGPRVRLRALGLDSKLEQAGPIDFSPCNSCDMACKEACPQKALTQGSYSRHLCMRQMNRDEAQRVIPEKEVGGDSPSTRVRYCRACELACPVGLES